jgi:transcriptional regulator with XRE-family HTH domain
VDQCKYGVGQWLSGLDDEAHSLAERLGRRIGRLRVAAGWSKTQLGHALGVRRQMVDRYENGLDLPRLNVALRICAVFGLEPNQLFSELLDAPSKIAPATSLADPPKDSMPRRSAHPETSR